MSISIPKISTERIFNGGKNLPLEVTSYDLLKTFAIITMIIDHMGYFFYPEIDELRIIGRLSAPVWFFLIGYAQTRALEWRLWVGGLVICAGNFLMGAPPLPLNILFTFLLIRATLDYIGPRVTQSFDKLFGIFWLFTLMGIPLMFFFEYSTFGYLFALTGYLTRHRQNLTALSISHHTIFAVLCVFGYWVSMQYWFAFAVQDSVILLALLLLGGLFLLSFQAREFSNGLLKPRIIKYPLFICGRRTLEIYVLHLLIFRYLDTYGLT